MNFFFTLLLAWLSLSKAAQTGLDDFANHHGLSIGSSESDSNSNYESKSEDDISRQDDLTTKDSDVLLELDVTTILKKKRNPESALNALAKRRTKNIAPKAKSKEDETKGDASRKEKTDESEESDSENEVIAEIPIEKVLYTRPLKGISQSSQSTSDIETESSSNEGGFYPSVTLPFIPTGQEYQSYESSDDTTSSSTDDSLSSRSTSDSEDRDDSSSEERRRRRRKYKKSRSYGTCTRLYIEGSSGAIRKEIFSPTIFPWMRLLLYTQAVLIYLSLVYGSLGTQSETKEGRPQLTKAQLQEKYRQFDMNSTRRYPLQKKASPPRLADMHWVENKRESKIADMSIEMSQSEEWRSNNSSPLYIIRPTSPRSVLSPYYNSPSITEGVDESSFDQETPSHSSCSPGMDFPSSIQTDTKPIDIPANKAVTSNSEEIDYYSNPYIDGERLRMEIARLSKSVESDSSKLGQ